MALQMLVPIHTSPDRNSDGLVRHVVEVAQHLEADVHALICVARFPQVHDPLASYLFNAPAMIAETRSQSLARGETTCNLLRSELAAAGIALQVEQAECLPAVFGETVAARARFYDLVLIGLDRNEQEAAATAEATIFGSGRPTLLVPEAGPPSALDHVVIAWDGSAVAARAVAHARDLIRHARMVGIVTVVGEKPLPDGLGGERLAGYLQRHGIKADVRSVQSDGRPIANMLQEHVRNVGGNLLVMGAFGHSRVRDFVLGGATQGILSALEVPVLLSH